MSQSSFARNSIRLILGNIFTKAAAFLASIIYSRFLGPFGVGQLAGAMSFVNIYTTLGDSGIPQSAAYAMGQKHFTPQRIVSSIATIWLASSVLGMVICAAILGLSSATQVTGPMILLIVLLIPCNLWKSYSQGIMLGLGRVGQFVVADLAAASLLIAGSLVLVAFLRFGVMGALIGSLVAAVVPAGYALYCVLKVAPPVPSRDWECSKILLTRGFSYGICVFVAQLNYIFDRVLMQYLSTLSELGIYTTAATMASLTWFVADALRSNLFSKVATAEDPSQFTQKIAQLFRVILVVSLGMVVGLIVISPILIPAIYGRKFAGSTVPMILLMPGTFAFISYKVLNAHLSGIGRPTVVLWATVPGLILNCLLNLFMIPHFGAIGASISSSVSYSMIAVHTAILFCRETGITMKELLTFKKSDWDWLTKRLKARLKAS